MAIFRIIIAALLYIFFQRINTIKLPFVFSTIKCTLAKDVFK